MAKVKVPNFSKEVEAAQDKADAEVEAAREKLDAAEDAANEAEERARVGVAAKAAAFIAKVLSPKTWVQDMIYNGKGAYCMTGWIDHVDQGLEEPLTNAVEMCLPKGSGSIEEYNDAKGRTVAQVKAVFVKAAALLKKQAAAF